MCVVLAGCKGRKLSASPESTEGDIPSGKFTRGTDAAKDRLEKQDNGLSAPDLSGDSEAGPGQAITSAAVLVRHWRRANQTEPFKIFERARCRIEAHRMLVTKPLANVCHRDH